MYCYVLWPQWAVQDNQCLLQPPTGHHRSERWSFAYFRNLQCQSQECPASNLEPATIGRQEQHPHGTVPPSFNFLRVLTGLEIAEQQSIGTCPAKRCQLQGLLLGLFPFHATLIFYHSYIDPGHHCLALSCSMRSQAPTSELVWQLILISGDTHIVDHNTTKLEQFYTSLIILVELTSCLVLTSPGEKTPNLIGID